VISAIGFIRPPQLGHSKTSIAKTAASARRIEVRVRVAARS